MAGTSPAMTMPVDFREFSHLVMAALVAAIHVLFA